MTISKNKQTSSPDFFFMMKGLLHMKMPVVSLEQPSLHVNPSSGAFWSPNQSPDLCRCKSYNSVIKMACFFIIFSSFKFFQVASDLLRLISDLLRLMSDLRLVCITSTRY